MIVLTGGYENSTSKLASEYSAIDDQQVLTDFFEYLNIFWIFFVECVLKVSVRELALMKHSRHAHACGAYHLGQVQVRYFGAITSVWYRCNILVQAGGSCGYF